MKQPPIRPKFSLLLQILILVSRFPLSFAKRANVVTELESIHFRYFLNSRLKISNSSLANFCSTRLLVLALLVAFDQHF